MSTIETGETKEPTKSSQRDWPEAKFASITHCALLHNGQRLIFSSHSELKEVQRALDHVHGPGRFMAGWCEGSNVRGPLSGPLYAFHITDTQDSVTPRDQRLAWFGVACLAIAVALAAAFLYTK